MVHKFTETWFRLLHVVPRVVYDFRNWKIELFLKLKKKDYTDVFVRKFSIWHGDNKYERWSNGLFTVKFWSATFLVLYCNNL